MQKFNTLTNKGNPIFIFHRQGEVLVCFGVARDCNQKK